MSLEWLQPLRDLFGGFAWPWMWAAFPLPWLVAWLLPAQGTNASALKLPLDVPLRGIAAPGVRNYKVRVRWLAWLAWFLLCAAAARPQELGEAVAPPQSARDLMLAVDLSGSMSEPDMELGGVVVDRLTAAKAVLADFLDRRVGDRVGLLVFGQKAYAMTPLTLDRDAVREQLQDSVVGLAGRETAIGDAIGLAVKRLHAQPEGQRVLILLTDGVNTAGLLDPIKAAEVAANQGVRIHTIAFGGSGAQLSLFGLQLPIPSAASDEIDEAGLKRVAELTGGRFFRARDAAELAGIYSEIDKVEPVQQQGEQVQPKLERYWWPLGGALLVALLSSLSGLLSVPRLRR